MTDHADPLRRHQGPAGSAGLDPLSRAVAARDDDFEHPSHDVLEAYVDGVLDDADREWIESHVEGCAVCLDDVGDLTRMREALRAVAPGMSAPPAAAFVDAPDTARRWFAAAAAVVIVGGAAYFWMSSRRIDAPLATAATNAPVAPAAPAPSPATPANADPLSADERARVDRVLASGRLDVPAALSALAARRGTLLGEPADARDVLSPLSPMGTAIVATRPAFTWTAAKDATAYDVAVFDERFNEVASATGVTGTSWTPSKALPRGVTLSWQVTAHVAGRTVLAPVPPQPEARFLVVDAKVEAAVTADRQRLAADPVALAVLLAEQGLFADALAELSRAPADGQSAKVRAAITSLTRR